MNKLKKKRKKRKFGYLCGTCKNNTVKESEEFLNVALSCHQAVSVMSVPFSDIIV